jgi:hypothetical protein
MVELNDSISDKAICLEWVSIKIYQQNKQQTF